MAAEEPIKRQRRHNGDVEASSSSAVQAAATPARRHVFAPYLAMGIIANEVPFVMQVRRGGKDAARPDVNIVTSLGDCWSIWTAESLVQVFVGRSLPSPITSLALSTSPDCILAAAGDTIHRFVRASVVAEYKASSGIIQRFIVFGDSIIALTHTALHHFSLSTGQEHQAIELPCPAGVVPTALLHPSTYLHKVLVAFSNGSVQLWNIRTATLLHQFDVVSATDSAQSPSILSLAQTPALDVIAATTSDDRIVLHNIKENACVMAFAMQAQLSTTPPTFRTDGRAHTMAVGSRSGDIFIFDLETEGGGRLIHTIRNAHSAPVAGLEFVAGQPLLISSAADNAIKEWFFEPASSASTAATSAASSSSSSTSLPRLLKSREGHSQPPTIVRWYGEDGRAPLLSAGRDRSVRLGWIGREARGGELSQGSVVRKANHLSLPAQSLKLAPASSLAFSLTRSRDWEDILTVHPGGAPPRVWLGKDRRMNATPLALNKKQQTTQGAGRGEAACAFVTHCGNFAVVGMSDGHVVVWNMQSRRFVRAFDCLDEGEAGSRQSARVVGLVVDEGNTTLTAVLSRGDVVAFDFHSTRVLLRTSQPHAIASVRSSAHRTLLALIPVGVSHPLVVLDLTTHRVVRRFGPFGGARVTDVAFSPTLRSLVVATMNGGLETFDVPSGRLMDRMRLREAMVSVDWSPDGSMVAGCGTEGKGIYLWSWTGARGRIVEDDDEEMLEGAEAQTMPSVRGPEEEGEAAAGEEALGLDALSLEAYRPTSDPLARGEEGQDDDEVASRPPLFTLSMQARTKWTTLLNLDAIKARDRPKSNEVDKSKAKPAPFFLGMSSATPGSAVDGTKGNGLVDGLGSGASGAAAAGFGANGIDEQEDEEGRTTFMERSHRLELANSTSTPLEALLLNEDSDEDERGSSLFTYLLSLSAPQLDLTLRLDLTSLRGASALLLACARRVGQAGRDVEGVAAIVEALRRARWGEMLGLEGEAQQLESSSGDEEEERRELRAAWSMWLRAIKAANDRVGDLLDYNIGTLSFLRGLAVV